MSDYIKITDYAAKDNLLTGNPAKLVKGAEIGADFDAVVVAVATKANTDSPTLVTPNLGVATATSINKVTITAPATSATLTVANGKTLTASNTLTLAGTDSTTMTFPATSGTVLTAALQNAITNPSNLSVNFGTGALTAGTGTFSGAVTVEPAAGNAELYLKTTATDWRLFSRTSDATFSIIDDTNGKIPFKINANSADNTCVLSSTGLSVTGTLSTTDNLSVTKNNGTTIGTSFQQTLSSGASAQRAELKLTDGVNASALLSFLPNATTASSVLTLRSAGSTVFQVNGTTDAATLDASGNLSVGASAPAAGSNRLYVASSSAYACLIEQVGTGAAASIPLSLINGGTSGDNKFASFYTDGTAATATLRGSIDYNRAGGLVRYNTTSDKTLKTRIGPAPVQKSLDILNGTVLEEYYWNDDETKKPQIGPFAQDLYEVFKGAVSVGGEYEETDAEGNTVTKYRPWGVDKTAHIFHLIAGWQEHQRIIQELTTRIAQLEAK